MTSISEVDSANHYTIKASYKKGQIFHVESYNVLLFGRVKIKMHVSYIEWSLAMILTNINLQKDEVFTKFLRIRAFYKVSLTALWASRNIFCCISTYLHQFISASPTINNFFTFYSSLPMVNIKACYSVFIILLCAYLHTAKLSRKTWITTRLKMPSILCC